MLGRYSGSDGGLKFVVVLLIAGVAIVVALVLSDSRPRSSVGVETIGNNAAIISEGDTLVLTSSCGKSCSHTWLVTYDGDKTVKVDDSGGFMPQHHTGTLCGVDCATKVDMGWLRSGLDIVERADRTVEVHWPWLWGYREYRQPDK